VHVFGGAIGVSVILAASAEAFTLMKLAGAAYLIWLGVQTWRAPDPVPEEGTAEGARRAFRQGILVEATNPKTAAFFLAFIPQFVRPEIGFVPAQFVVLGLVSVLLNTGVDVLVAFGAARVRGALLRRAIWARRIRQGSGALMCGLGVTLALARRPG
jgi:threonine/homoserine/homoserine lactone efflux protein